MEKNLKNNAIKNIIYAFSAQIVSITLSVCMSLVVPKLLGVTDFSYWQLFLFYTTYVGFFHFGITDGVYLKTGGIEFEEVNKKELSSQFWMLLGILFIFFIIITTSSFFFIKSDIRRYVLIFTGFYLIIANLNWYIGYIFQATNKVKYYSASVVIDKTIFLVFIIIAVLFRIRLLKLYIPIFVSTTAAALLYSLYRARKIIFTKPCSIKESLKLTFSSAKIGINLTLSSISSLLILGVGRFLVDRTWGIESFGKFSLALSLTNFFLLFIAQVSIVLFPTLRQVSNETAKKLFVYFNKIMDSILPAIFVVYVPMKIVLSWWLPQYKISLDYLAMLLPICIFDGKNQMINNTYFKVLREEKKMLKINLITLLVSFVLSFVSVFVIKSIYAVIVSMLISIAVRNIMGEVILSKNMNLQNNSLNTIYELVFSVLFIVYNLVLRNSFAFILTLMTFLVYVLLTKSYQTYSDLYKQAKEKVLKRKSY